MSNSIQDRLGNGEFLFHLNVVSRATGAGEGKHMFPVLSRALVAPTYDAADAHAVRLAGDLALPSGTWYYDLVYVRWPSMPNRERLEKTPSDLVIDVVDQVAGVLIRLAESVLASSAESQS